MKYTITPSILFHTFLKVVACTSLVLSFSACKKDAKKEDPGPKMIGYEENLADMKIKTAQLIAHIRQYKVEETDELRLVCYFYTDKKENMEKLSAVLGKMEYPVNAGEYSAEKPYVINAKSPYVKMDEESIMKWVNDMCKLSSQYNCVMNGWSVDPKQPRKLVFQ